MRITMAFHSGRTLLLLAGVLSCQGRPAVVEDGGGAEPWVRVEGPGVGASWHTATLLEDGTVLIAGTTMPDQRGALRYFPGDNRMVAAGVMATKHGHHGAVRLVDGRVLIAAGGTDWSNDPVQGTDLFDPVSPASWSVWPTTVMPIRSDPAMIQVPGGDVFLIGGMVFGAPQQGPVMQPFVSGEQVERYQASTGKCG